MGLKIKKVEFDWCEKKRVILAKDVTEIGIVGGNCIAVDRGTGIVEIYSCDWMLTQEEVPDIIESKIVGVS